MADALLHCIPIFFLDYLTNAEYMISIWPFASKSTGRSPIISSAYGVNFQSSVLDKFLYVVGKSDVPL